MEIHNPKFQMSGQCCGLEWTFSRAVIKILFKTGGNLIELKYWSVGKLCTLNAPTIVICESEIYDIENYFVYFLSANKLVVMLSESPVYSVNVNVVVLC